MPIPTRRLLYVAVVCVLAAGCKPPTELDLVGAWRLLPDSGAALSPEGATELFFDGQSMWRFEPGAARVRSRYKVVREDAKGSAVDLFITRPDGSTASARVTFSADLSQIRMAMRPHPVPLAKPDTSATADWSGVPVTVFKRLEDRGRWKGVEAEMEAERDAGDSAR